MTVDAPPQQARLKRSLTLPYVVLYGLGVTIGAGIYVLVGEAAGRAGHQAPIAFIIAGIVMVFPVASFAELAGRLPFAAGEARFVDAAFGKDWLTLAVGLAVAGVGLVSSAAIGLGSAGYVLSLTGGSLHLVFSTIIVAMGAIAALGIRQSILIAGVLTLVEAGGLIAIITGALVDQPRLLTRLPEIMPSEWTLAPVGAIASASLLAFFAFIGFEDIDSLAEETKDPQRTLPRAMFATLVVSMVLYVGVTAVAVLTVEPETLAADTAPLATVFHAVTGAPGTVITAIAILATLNGVIVQIIMVARVLYGLASAKRLPGILARIHPRTGTPVVATVFATAVIVLLGLAFPIGPLAEWTSRITLSIFVVVCAALMVIKRQGTPAPAGTFIVPMWVPAIGMVLNLALLFAGG